MSILNRLQAALDSLTVSTTAWTAHLHPPATSTSPVLETRAKTPFVHVLSVFPYLVWDTILRNVIHPASLASLTRVCSSFHERIGKIDPEAYLRGHWCFSSRLSGVHQNGAACFASDDLFTRVMGCNAYHMQVYHAEAFMLRNRVGVLQQYMIANQSHLACMLLKMEWNDKEDCMALLGVYFSKTRPLNNDSNVCSALWIPPPAESLASSSPSLFSSSSSRNDLTDFIFVDDATKWWKTKDASTILEDEEVVYKRSILISNYGKIRKGVLYTDQDNEVHFRLNLRVYGVFGGRGRLMYLAKDSCGIEGVSVTEENLVWCAMDDAITFSYKTTESTFVAVCEVYHLRDDGGDDGLSSSSGGFFMLKGNFAQRSLFRSANTAAALEGADVVNRKGKIIITEM
eukprot:TRINITY_DN11416_c0_g1_i3.p1 TRINITY_DN11416_c0_g1~~TRINITY_DN11416_c0_g1_i3.p1  ORF type:complete len:428 (-),score=61.57 TRINITY_DN11416_c0_g1_i3:10-1209(-)